MGHSRFFKKVKKPNHEGKNIFCRKLAAILRKNIKIVAHEDKIKAIIPNHTINKYRKQMAWAKVIPNIKLTGKVKPAIFEIGIEAEMRFADAYEEYKKSKLEGYMENKKYANGLIYEEFKKIEISDLDFITVPIGNEIANATGNLFNNLNKKDCEKLAVYVANKMLSYIGSGEANSKYTLGDNLRIGLTEDVELMDFSNRKFPTLKSQVHPRTEMTGHRIKCVLRNLDWGLDEKTNRIRIFNKTEEHLVQPVSPCKIVNRP